MKIKCPKCGEEISAAEIASQMGKIKTKKKSLSSANNLKEWREKKKNENK